MKGVFIIPTGIGCEIGGHAGDANPAVKLIASVCDKLIVNPNAVNASDINEMPDNCLYVEGSTIDRFLQDYICLQEVKSNKVLVVTNSPLKNEVVNSVNAARATIGLEAEILALKTPLELIAEINSDGTAGGLVKGWEELCEQVKDRKFDALAITTGIDVDKDIALGYLKEGKGVNPYGAVEAKASKLISVRLDKPVAHSPTESEWFKTFNEIVDPRLSAELVSISYLHCILKGLWRAPRLHNGYNVGELRSSEIDFMISPYGCWGIPHKACEKAGIPIIVVKENKTICEDVMGHAIFVKNYLEACGVISAINNGISLESVRRPLEQVKIY